MRLPRSGPFVLFRFVEPPGGDILVYPDPKNRVDRADFEGITRRVERHAAEAFPGASLEADYRGGMPDKVACLLLRCGEQTSLWTGMDHAALTAFCREVMGWLTEPPPPTIRV